MGRFFRSIFTRNNEGGQAVLEYALLLFFALGIFLTILRPELTKFAGRFTDRFSSGVFAADDSGDAFYTFHVR